MIIFRILLIASAFTNSSFALAGEKIVSGKFKVISISRAVKNCESPEFEKRKTTAPGCILKLRQLDPENRSNLIPMEISYYGGDGSCKQTKGSILDLRISDYCAFRKVTGCDPQEPKHSNAMWGCVFRSWYNAEDPQVKEYPEDTMVLLIDQRQQDRIHNWKGKEK